MKMIRQQFLVGRNTFGFRLRRRIDKSSFETVVLICVKLLRVSVRV